MQTFLLNYFLLSCEWRFFFLFVTSSNILYPHFSSSKQMEDGWEKDGLLAPKGEGHGWGK